MTSSPFLFSHALPLSLFLQIMNKHEWQWSMIQASQRWAQSITIPHSINMYQWPGVASLAHGPRLDTEEKRTSRLIFMNLLGNNIQMQCTGSLVAQRIHTHCLRPGDLTQEEVFSPRAFSEILPHNHTIYDNTKEQPGGKKKQKTWLSWLFDGLYDCQFVVRSDTNFICPPQKQ